MSCESCKSTEEKGGAPSGPYIVHEAEMARMERINRRLAIAAALEAVALVLVVILMH